MVPRLSDSLELDDWPRWWSGLGSGHHPRRGAVTTLVHQVGFELHPFRVKEPVIRLEPMRYTGCIGHGKRASPAPSPRWGGVEKANCGSSEPWNRRGGGSFDPRHPRVWECASRRGSQTGSPHGVGKPPVLFAPHGASEKPVRLTESGLSLFPHRVPPHGFSPASRRSSPTGSPHGVRHARVDPYGSSGSAFRNSCSPHRLPPTGSGPDSRRSNPMGTPHSAHPPRIDRINSNANRFH